MTEGRRVGEQEIKEALAYADGLFSQQRFEEASKIYSDVAREIEFQFGEDLHANRSMANHPAIPVHIYALQKMGDCLHGTSQLRDCIPIYERVVRAKSRFQTGFDNDYADLIMKIARTYEQLGNYNESKNTYEEALMLVRAALGFEHPLFQRVHQAYENLTNKINQRKKIADALKSAFSETDVSAVASSIASGVHPTQSPRITGGFAIDPSLDPTASTGGVQYPPVPSGKQMIISTPLQAPAPASIQIPPAVAEALPGTLPIPVSVPVQMPVQMAEQGEQPGAEFPSGLLQMEGSNQNTQPVQGIIPEPIPPAAPDFNNEGHSPFMDFGHNQMPFEPRRKDPVSDPYTQHLAAKVSDLKSRRETQEVEKPAFPEMPAPEEMEHNPDPYMDHLAARVAELRAQVSSIPSGVKKASQSGIWNLADLAAEVDITSPEGVSWHIQEVSQQQTQGNEAVKWEMPSVEEIKLISHRETLAPDVPVDKTSARRATIKGEKLSNSIVFAREYLLALIVIVGLIVGGLFLFKDSKQKEVQLGSQTQAFSQAQGKSQTYISGDGKLSLSIGANDLSTYQDGKVGIQVPTVFYNNPLKVAQQWIDSIMERQLWFSRETQNNTYVSENGVKLYALGSPELKMAAEAKNWYTKAKVAYANPQNAASVNLKLPQNVSVRTVTEVTAQDTKDHLSTLHTGQLLMEETKPGPLEIKIYLFSERADKSPTVYVRASDSRAGWIGTKQSGQALVLGSDPELLADRGPGKITVPPKPTKVWIGDNISSIVYFIHYWVPLFLGITGGALLVVGNKKDLHAVSVSGYVVLFLACLAAIAQYVIWL